MRTRGTEVLGSHEHWIADPLDTRRPRSRDPGNGTSRVYCPHPQCVETTYGVCGYSSVGLRQTTRMRMWAVARQYTIPQTIQMANRRVVGSRPHRISATGSRDLRDLGQWDHDTSRCSHHLSAGQEVCAIPPHTAYLHPWHTYVALAPTAYRVLGAMR